MDCFSVRMTLILPDGFNEGPPTFDTVGPNACIYTRTTCANIVDYVDNFLGQVPDEMSTELTIAHNDIAAKCARLCAKGCWVRATLIADSAGLELPQTPEEEVFTSVVLNGALMEDPEQEGLSVSAQHVKNVVEQRQKVFLEGHPEADSMASLGYPEITDAAYQTLADITQSNFHIILSVISHLCETGRAQQQEDIVETSAKHRVLLDDPKIVTEKEVKLLLAHPDLQYQFYLQAQPKGTL